MATTIRYHKQQTDGKLVPCPAKIRCRLAAAAHTNLTRDQALFMRDVMGVKVQIPHTATYTKAAGGAAKTSKRQSATGTPTIAEGTVNDLVRQRVEEVLADRDFEMRTGLSRQQFAALGTGPSQFADRFPAAGDAAYAVDYNSDSYRAPDYLADEDDGYGRNRQFRGLRVDPDINAEAVALSLFGPKTLQARAAAVAYVYAHGLNHANAYEVEARWGYYGEEAEVSMLPEQEAAAREWFYAFGNAEDENHLLAKAREVGVDTTAMEPTDALKAILKRTRPATDWERMPKLQQIASIHTKSLFTRQLKLTAADLDWYGAPATRPGHGEAIGIVLHDPVDNSYLLVDGQEHVKEIIDTPGSQRKYIVAELQDTRPRDRRGRIARN